MACLTQGSPLPNITTSQTQVTTAPSFYTNYLSCLANKSINAANSAQYVGASPLQQQAFNQVGSNVGNYQPALSGATSTLNRATNINPLCAANPYFNRATTAAPCKVSSYMNPYVKCVVNSIGTLGQQNIAQNLAPQSTAGLVGTGGFGSARGQQALGQVLAGAGENITAQQACALKAGYCAAIKAAQTQNQICATTGANVGSLVNQNQANLLNASKLGLCAATTTQNLGLGCVNALATLGCQQRTLAQNQQLFPLQTAAAAGNVMKGLSVPTAVSSTYNGPIPGAYAPSPLATALGAGGLLFGQSANGSSLAGTLGSGLSALGSAVSPVISGALGSLFGCAGKALCSVLVNGGNLNGIPVKCIPAYTQALGSSSGLFGCLGSTISSWFGSDRRLKENIRKVGTLKNGLNLYSFNYKMGGPTRFGVMADEVKKIKPEAVRNINGYDYVNYGAL